MFHYLEGLLKLGHNGRRYAMLVLVQITAPTGAPHHGAHVAWPVSFHKIFIKVNGFCFSNQHGFRNARCV